MGVTLPKLLTRLLGRRAMGRTPGEEAVEWAVAELVSGNYSPHLRRLAGYDRPYHGRNWMTC